MKFTSDASNPSPGDWACIFFGELSGSSSFKHCIVEYGEDQINTTGNDSNNSFTVQNCIIRYAGYEGILLGLTGNPNIQFNTIYGNINNGIGLHRSMTVQKSVTIQNNIITNNGFGIGNGTDFSFTTSYNDVWNNNTNNYSSLPPSVINHEKDITVDPLYMNLANDDVHLKSGSLCLQATSTGGEIGAYGNSAPIKPTINNPGINMLLLDNK
ncbi:MAG: right-handed parallel beta-helix repeat-containing protein [Candidatus Electrothrix sp. MAN1_4]|nr:right-handed parallel beta-helix repeat-containing protein [Candidatus Electrothrix sp. MAN1_4]